MREHSEEAAHECQGAFRHTQREKQRETVCVFMSERKQGGSVSAA